MTAAFAVCLSSVAALSDNLRGALVTEKQHFGCTTAIVQLTDAADKFFLKIIGNGIGEAHLTCLTGATLALRVSAFDLTFADPPRYPIDRRDRGERISRTSFDPLVQSDSFVFFTELESPIDSIRYSADGAFAKVFDSKVIQHDSSDCILASTSPDRSSALADISLYKITTATESGGAIELKLDETKLDSAVADLVECIRELSKFSNSSK